MHSILDVIHATDSVSKRLTEAAASAEHAPELSPKEQAKAIIAKNRVLKILSRNIRDVETALYPSGKKETKDVAVNEELLAMDAASDDGKPPSDVISGGMNGKDSDLSKQVPSMTKLADDVGPVIDTFNSVLTKPYLKNYSAMSNTVPIVGLKGDNVMYSETKSGGVKGVQDVWSVFSRIPDGVNINSSKAVHFFPYCGDFCMSVGKAIWRKKHRAELDPVIKQAVDNWPRLFLDSWEKVGDECLPTANARSVLPFARLTGKDIRFHLVVLDEAGRLQSLDGDLNERNTFTEMKNATPAKPENAKTDKDAAARALKIQKAAYWNGNIVALDDSNNTWNLDADFDADTFLPKDQFAIEPLFELTATDIGPVGVKKDGWIYRRRLETVTDPSDKTTANEDKKLGWEKWMQQSGVTNLGTASPGVMLNLEALTRSLRERYISTQTSIYPVMNKLQAFAITHELFLKKQLAAAEEYQKATDSNKQTIAIKEAKKLVSQTKIWSTIIRGQSNHGKDAVNLMGEELSSVKTQLDQQLIVLQDKLVSLEAQIKALKEAKAKMDAAFWGAIGAMILGIGLAIIGVATGVGVVTLGIVGGALFVGGLVAACYFGVKSTELAAQIAEREAEARGVTQAIADIKSVAGKFGDLEGMYGSLNMFWGRMFNAAQNLKDMDDATAMQLGIGILEDTTSIEASMSVVKDMKNGTARYLAVLNRQGIKIEDDDEDEDEDDETADMEMVSLSDDTIVVDPTFHTIKLFNTQVERANAALENDQFGQYLKHMETADMIDIYTTELGMPVETISQALTKATGGNKDVEAADLFSDFLEVAKIAAPFANGPLGAALGGQLASQIAGKLLPIHPNGVNGTKHITNGINGAKDTNGANGLKQALNGIHSENSGDLFRLLGEALKYVPEDLAVDISQQLTARDVDMSQSQPDTEIEAQPEESADIFGAIAGVAGLSPIFGLGGPLAVVPYLVGNAGAVSGLALLRNGTPFSAQGSSGVLNSALSEGRNGILAMVEKTIALTETSERWLKQIPDVPTSKSDLDLVSVLQAEALLACKEAIENARKANNAFTVFNQKARDESERLSQEITLLRDRWSASKARYAEQIRQKMKPQVADFFSLGLNRLSVMVDVQRIEAARDNELSSIDYEISRRDQELQCGQQFLGSSGSWVELCKRTSGNLGSIYNNLTAVKYGIKIDPVAYKNMMDTQWDEILREANDVKSILLGNGAARDLEFAMDVAADLQPGSSLARISLPGPSLLQQLQSQASNSKVVWENIGLLQRMTYTDDIVAYFDATTKGKITLLDVISDIRSVYIQTAGTQYETIEHISSLALLQQTRAANLAKGKISPHVFVKGTILSVSIAASKGARVKALMAQTAPELRIKLELVKGSISYLKKAIADANLDLARRDKAYRDKVTGFLVEGILTGFATGGLVAAAAFAAVSGAALASIPALLTAGGVVFSGFQDGEDPAIGVEDGAGGDEDEDDGKPEEEEGENGATNGGEAAGGDFAMDKKDAAKPADKKAIPMKKRVQAAQDTWTSLSRLLHTAKDAAAATTLGKALFNKMSLPELAMLVQLVRTAIVVMERTVSAVERLTKPLDELMDSVSAVADILESMNQECENYQTTAGSEPVVFGKQDAEEVKAKWDEISNASTAWLDVFNEQRISPLSYTTI